MTEFEPLLEYQIEINASTDAVWALVSDPRRMAEFSPQVESCEFDEDGPATVGRRFTNHNVHGELRWDTHGEIVRWAPSREIAFRIKENYVVWVFRLEPTDGGSILTEQRTTPEGISAMSLHLADTYLGGQAAFTEVQRQGMQETLRAIKAAVEVD